MKIPIKMGPTNDMLKNKREKTGGGFYVWIQQGTSPLGKVHVFFFRLSHWDYWASSGQEGYILTLKAPITTAADNKFSDIFPNFQQK